MSWRDIRRRLSPEAEARTESRVREATHEIEANQERGMQEITSEVMYGIAKKFNKEMEAFPLHTHSAIVELVRVGMQHRSLAAQREEAERKQEQDDEIVKHRGQQLELAMAAERRAAAAKVAKPFIASGPTGAEARNVEQLNAGAGGSGASEQTDAEELAELAEAHDAGGTEVVEQEA
jgi:hypothetical protein